MLLAHLAESPAMLRTERDFESNKRAIPRQRYRCRRRWFVHRLETFGRWASRHFIRPAGGGHGDIVWQRGVHQYHGMDAVLDPGAVETLALDAWQ